jgi:hypothetical protein
VASLVARDPEGGLVTYSILAGNHQDHFTIEESTGVVRVNQPLDREDTRLYTLVSIFIYTFTAFSHSKFGHLTFFR